MSNWSSVSYPSIEDLRRRLAEVVGDIDPASPRGKKRRRILEAAIGQFVAHGYRKTNIDAIARDAGIAKGTVYLHFATKADLLICAIAREKQRLFSLVDGIFEADATPRDRLRRWIEAAVLMVAGSPLLARAVSGDPEILAVLVELDPKRVAQASAENDGIIGELLDDLASPQRWEPQARHERVAVIRALSRFAPLIRSDPLRQGMTIERFAAVLAEVLVDGLRPPQPRPSRRRRAT